MMTDVKTDDQPAAQEARPALDVRHLSTVVKTASGVVPIVNDISFDVRPGETVALVGESGSGKSMTALAIMGLLSKGKTEVTDGSINVQGRDIRTFSSAQLRAIRGQEISMIFQEPMNSLNPVMTIGEQVTEGLRVHRSVGKAEAFSQGVDLLKSVGIRDAEHCMSVYPHQLSGGMRQRVMIASALSCQPQLLIADEPTTALDVTTQAQILDLLAERCANTKVAVLLITHDLGIVARYADRVNVMYAGSIMEQADVRSLFKNPLHPYTSGLMAAIPRIDQPRLDSLTAIEGLPPIPGKLPEGCVFRDRCQYAEVKCGEAQELRTISEGHTSACWKAEQLASTLEPAE